MSHDTSTDPKSVHEVLGALITRFPRRYGRAAGVRVGPGRTPDPIELDRAAKVRTLIHIILDRRDGASHLDASR